ncbi:MAG: pilus assembly FimT family protein [Clostridium sp.]|uniref:prepilin-type N-terminal cleavage/methylation domain-containing protein n=1 Tax=Clostridium TaxID=1485 RepID=UPI0021539023|nr:prepilin-type N-terminal cleavage/methylation domain-containing protein [Clostridium sp. LY3-2]MCR6515880.1 prepilin-type N-terminal cleavage/methylation domain-containing protein [Clostridium sp. LY3-2]
MKNKGFTLIELIAVLAIMLILSSIGSLTFKGLNNIKNDNANEQFISELRMLISTGKKISVSESMNTNIIIDENAKKIKLSISSKVKDSIKIPSNLRFNSIKRDILIKSDGRIEPFTWMFKDGDKEYSISRPVEGDYINVKKP